MVIVNRISVLLLLLPIRGVTANQLGLPSAIWRYIDIELDIAPGYANHVKMYCVVVFQVWKNT